MYIHPSEKKNTFLQLCLNLIILIRGNFLKRLKDDFQNYLVHRCTGGHIVCNNRRFLQLHRTESHFYSENKRSSFSVKDFFHIKIFADKILGSPSTVTEKGTRLPLQKNGDISLIFNNVDAYNKKYKYSSAAIITKTSLYFVLWNAEKTASDYNLSA